MSQILRFVVLATAGLFLTSTPALAADPWSAPSAAVTAGAAGSRPATSPIIAADASGALTAIWLGDQAGTTGIYAASRPVDGAWSGAVLVAPGTTLTSLTLAVNASGQALAGWLDAPSDNASTLKTASRAAATATWSAPQAVQAPLTGGSVGLTLDFDLALSPAGHGQSVWTRAISGPGGDATESKLGLGGLAALWSSADAPGAGASDLRIGIDGAGTATLAYLAADSHLYSATRPAGGSWSTAKQLDTWATADGPSAAPSSPELRVNATGDAVATWQQERATTDNPTTDLLASTRHAGAWSIPAVVTGSTAGSTFIEPQLGIDDSGSATVAWTTLGATASSVTTQVEARTGTAAGVWNAAAPVSAPLVSDTAAADIPILLSATLAVGPSGPVAVVWRKGAQSGSALYAAGRRTGAAWQSPVKIADYSDANAGDGQPIGLVVDALGRATALWGDGRSLKTSSAALADPKPVSTPTPTPTSTPAPTPTPDAPAPTPAPVQLPTGGTAPAPPAPAPAPPAPAPPVVTKPLATPPAVAKRLVLAAALVPSKKGKCPATGVATYAGGKTTIKLKKAKLSNKKIVCKVATTITLKAAPATPTVKVTITAKGVKKKAFNVKPTA